MSMQGMVIDMLEGFTRFGSLASQRVHTRIPEQVNVFVKPPAA